jgi:Mycothiol maleylpyruvate isomerase N-terminal domain
LLLRIDCDCANVPSVDVRGVYLAAATAFCELVRQVPRADWERPGLGVWTVRELVGHTSTAISGVILALDEPAETESLTSPEGYYAFGRTLDPAIYAAAVAAATASAGSFADELGTDPVTSIQQLLERVTDSLGAVEGDPLIQSAAGGMRLSAWLPTRTLELTVHALDLAARINAPARLPATAVAEVAAVLGRLAAATGEGTTVLRALTGRASLPEGFTVI